MSDELKYLYALIPIGVVTAVYLIRKLREWQWGWVKNVYSLKNKLYIITGANTGLGYETAKALVARDATVIMACRNLTKANEAVASIRQKTAKGELIVMELDLCSFDSIKKFANEIIEKYPKFDVLINNAGLSMKTNEFTKENIEIHFGVNHLGHFLLTNLLKNVIQDNESRIVIVSSKMHKKGEIDFENMTKGLAPNQSGISKLYSNSKLANFYFAKELYKKHYDVHVLCPGLCYTDFFRNYNPKWYHFLLFSPIVLLYLRSAEQGAQNIIHCATDNVNTETENPATGYIVTNLKQTKSKKTLNDQVGERLWEESLKLCSKALK